MDRRSFLAGLGAVVAAPAIPAVLEAEAPYGVGPMMLALDAQRARNEDFFLRELFRTLSEHPTMTSTQIIELVNENGLLAA